jgi:site-specific DNA-methyltransferase (adenine-specific)
MIDLRLGDCFTGIKAINRPIDCVVTSPPYNLGKKYNNYNDTRPQLEYIEWLHEWAAITKDKLAENGSIFLVMGSRPSYKWTPHEVVLELRDLFCLQNTIVWVKSICVNGTTTGHFKPVNSKKYINDCFEYIFHLTHRGDVDLDRLAAGVPYQHKSNIKRWAKNKRFTVSEPKRCRGNTWFIPYETRHAAGVHPAVFPWQLARQCIQLAGCKPKKSLVVDPFAGIGSTAIACQDLNVNFIGFEIDQMYYDYSLELLAEKKPTVLVDSPVSETPMATDKTRSLPVCSQMGQ